MKYYVLSVYDRAAMAYGRPVFAQALGASIRSFQDECNRDAPDNTMFAHAKDFDLFHLAMFDDTSGKFENLDQPLNVAHGGQMQLKLDVPASLLKARPGLDS